MLHKLIGVLMSNMEIYPVTNIPDAFVDNANLRMEKVGEDLAGSMPQGKYITNMEINLQQEVLAKIARLKNEFQTYNQAMAARKDNLQAMLNLNPRLVSQLAPMGLRRISSLISSRRSWRKGGSRW